MINSPILHDFYLPLKTPRLLIRPIMPGDGPKIWEAIEETREELEKWLLWASDVKCWQDSEKTARLFYANFILKKDFNFCIFQEDQFIGTCSLHDLNWSIPSASIGYWCRKTAQSQGYMTEAIRALTFWAFKEVKLKRLVILCDVENIKSRAIAERLGFTLELKAKGLIAIPSSSSLRTAYQFVRFDSDGLK